MDDHGDPGFGGTVVGWDGDGDGIDDLVTQGEDSTIVRFGSPLLAAGARDAETTWTTTGPEPDFWPVAALGDITGDGLPDVGFGDRTYQSSADRGGAAYVVAGGEVESKDAADIALQWQGTETGEAWGADLSSGDLDGDGQLDLVVGAIGLWPGEHPGMVTGYLGPIDSLEPAVAVFRIYGTERWSYFGVSSVIADADGDGLGDLYVGANHEEYGHGAVYRFDDDWLLQ